MNFLDVLTIYLKLLTYVLVKYLELIKIDNMNLIVLYITKHISGMETPVEVNTIEPVIIHIHTLLHYHHFYI